MDWVEPFSEGSRYKEICIFLAHFEDGFGVDEGGLHLIDDLTPVSEEENALANDEDPAGWGEVQHIGNFLSN